MIYIDGVLQTHFKSQLLGILNLKEVKKVTYHTRSKWFHLGIELDIEFDTLKVSIIVWNVQHNYFLEE